MTVMDAETENTENEPMVLLDSERDSIVDFLTNNDSISFKSQQRGENDLTKLQKTTIALELFEKSKLIFLTKFGTYLNRHHLMYFQKFTNDNKNQESYEIHLMLKNLLLAHDNKKIVRNRRFEALQHLIMENSYFTEVEMMKRNPVLYDHLVGQFLTADEIKQRDKFEMDNNTTLVKILMEGIERSDAKLKQEMEEDNEELSESTSGDEHSEEEEAGPSMPQWGEFHDSRPPKRKPKKKGQAKMITPQEQLLLKEEFITSMYQSFLDGKDEDFDYTSVDNNEKFDDNKTMDHDAEDRYFDAEEPEVVVECENAVESEDELDIFMSGINENVAVAELSNNLKKNLIN